MNTTLRRIRQSHDAQTGSTAPQSGQTWMAALGRPHATLKRSDRTILADAAIAIDQDLTATGYRLSVYDDMQAWAGLLASVGKFVPNAFDTKLKPARTGEALGLVLRSPEGELIATHGVRLYHLQRSLADHLATLSLFYANPIEQMLAGEYLSIAGDARRYAETVEGEAVWIGGFWVRPDHRGKASNISTVLAFAARLLAAMRWGSHVVFSLTEPMWRNSKASARIKNPDIYETVKWWRPQLPEAERERRSEILLVVTEPDVPMARARAYLSGEDRLRIGLEPENPQANATPV